MEDASGIKNGKPLNVINLRDKLHDKLRQLHLKNFPNIHRIFFLSRIALLNHSTLRVRSIVSYSVSLNQSYHRSSCFKQPVRIQPILLTMRLRSGERTSRFRSFTVRRVARIYVARTLHRSVANNHANKHLYRPVHLTCSSFATTFFPPSDSRRF